MKIYHRHPNPSNNRSRWRQRRTIHGTDRRKPMSTLDRRRFLSGTVAVGATLGSALSAWAQEAGLNLPKTLPEGLRGSAVLEALPGKKPLIKLSYRPPNYETPLEYFRTAITPTDAFFVRYHLSVIPEVNPNTWKD